MLANFRVVYICHKVVALVGIVYQIIEEIFIVNIRTAFFPTVCFRTNGILPCLCAHRAPNLAFADLHKNRIRPSFGFATDKAAQGVARKAIWLGNACAIQKRYRKV